MTDGEVQIKSLISCRSIVCVGMVVSAALALVACSGGGAGGSAAGQAENSQGSLALFAGVLGGQGYLDGLGQAARFGNPSQMASDAAGNVYVTDGMYSVIRKITPAGVVSTFAGSGASGSGDGSSLSASFSDPEGIAVDSNGNAYVADHLNHSIRKITAAGLVSTVAGSSGTSGDTDGAGSVARFLYPRGVAIGADGAIYVADSGNCRIRKIAAAGVVTTLAGQTCDGSQLDAAGSAAKFSVLSSLAADAKGNLYATDGTAVRKIVVATAEVSTLAGDAMNPGSSDGIGSLAHFSVPQGVAVDGDGYVYVADWFNHAIRKISPTGVVTTLAGLAGASGNVDAAGSAARFNYPTGITTGPSGVIYVADSSNYEIRRISPAGAVTTVAGLLSSAGSADGQGDAARFNSPWSVAADANGNLYVADDYNATLRKITSAGMVSTLAGQTVNFGVQDGQGSAASFRVPVGVATDLAGNIYVADAGVNTIRKVSPTGLVTTLAGLPDALGAADDGSGSNARFSQPAGLATDAAGNLYVADSGNHLVRKITPVGVVSTLAGVAGSAGHVDGAGSLARFNQPQAVAVDANGNVFVSDGSRTIRKITPAGVVSTLAGDPVAAADHVDATGAAARFIELRGMALDAQGNIYVVDGGTSFPAIRKVTQAGVVTTVVGAVFSRYRGASPGVLPAQLGEPRSVAVVGRKLYIADENAILMADLP